MLGRARYGQVEKRVSQAGVTAAPAAWSSWSFTGEGVGRRISQPLHLLLGPRVKADHSGQRCAKELGARVAT